MPALWEKIPHDSICKYTNGSNSGHGSILTAHAVEFIGFSKYKVYGLLMGTFCIHCCVTNNPNLPRAHGRQETHAQYAAHSHYTHGTLRHKQTHTPSIYT